MSSIDCDYYDTWSPKDLDIPTHSRLFHLKPIGTETSYVEAFTSYLINLAQAHCVSPQALTKHEFLPIVDEMLANKVRTDINSFWLEKLSTMLNGCQPSTTVWTRATQQLTLCDEIQYLSMARWRKIICHHNLMRQHHAWCPLCYDDLKRNSERIYDPLIWSLDIVRICPRHEVVLQNQCPFPDCNRKMQSLRSMSYLGHCRYCFRWLGEPSMYQIGNSLASDEIDFVEQRWLINQVGELLATTLDSQFKLQRRFIIQTIKWAINSISGGGLTQLGREMGLTSTKQLTNLQSDRPVDIKVLLKLCSFFDVSLLSLLDGSALQQLQGKPFYFNTIYKPRKPMRKFDKQHVETELTKNLNAPQSEQLTVQEISRKLGYTSASTLYHHFSDLCQKITMQRKADTSRPMQKKVNTSQITLRRPFDRKLLEARLIEALAEIPPPTLKAIAESIGCSCMTLYRHFPELNKAIAQKRRDFNALRRGSLVAHEYHFSILHQGNEYKRVEQILRSALVEDSPPSLIKLAKQAGWSDRTIRRHFPELSQALIDKRNMNQDIRPIHVSKRVEAKQHKQRIELELEKALIINPPLSILEVCRAVATSPDHIRNHFPDYFERLSQRYKSHRSEAKRARIERDISVLVTTIRMLHSEGLYPTEHRIKLALGGVLKDPIHRAAYLEELQRLGLK